MTDQERIEELEAGKDICRRTTKDYLDGKLLPGNWSDGTDGACPRWWRGLDEGCKKMEEKLLQQLADRDKRIDELEKLARTIYAPESFTFCNPCRICQDEAKRLIEKK